MTKRTPRTVHADVYDISVSNSASLGTPGPLPIYIGETIHQIPGVI